MLLSIYSAAILAAGHLAHAHPTDKRTSATNPTLAQALWINGEPALRGGSTTAAAITAAAQCTANDTVLACAGKIAENWQVATSAPSASRVLKVPCQINDPQNGHVGGCYFEAPITVGYSSCSLSDAILVHQGDAIDCNTASCTEQFTFEHSTTTSNAYTFTLQTTVKAGVNFDFVTAEVDVEAGFSNAWSESDTVTETVTKTYNMDRGDICAPSTVQFKIACKTTISGLENNDQGHYIAQVYDTFGNNLGGYWVCDDYRISGADVADICVAQKNPTVPINVDLGTGDATGGVWTMDGCMLNNY